MEGRDDVWNKLGTVLPMARIAFLIAPKGAQVIPALILYLKLKEMSVRRL